MNCSQCHAVMPDNKVVCQHCNFDNSHQVTHAKPKWIGWLIGSIAIIGVICLFVYINSWMSRAFGNGPLPFNAKPPQTVSSKNRQDQLINSLGSITIENTEVYDAPIKTQVRMNYVVPGKPSSDALKALLMKMYGTIRNQTGFKYHEHPTRIYLFVYSTVENAKLGNLWIARLAVDNDEGTPTIEVDELSLASIGKKPENVNGLTEETRKRIYYELYIVEGSGGGDNTAAHANLARKYHCKPDDINHIMAEGFEKKWPYPQSNQ